MSPAYLLARYNEYYCERTRSERIEISEIIRRRHHQHRISHRFSCPKCRFVYVENLMRIIISSIRPTGIMALPRREVTTAGFEKQIGVNHFGHAFLTSLLLDKMKAQDFNSRVVVVSSSSKLIRYHKMSCNL